ncbi:ABC transporter ATP-binding protein [Candidatus Roizmanbacteria bacterium]|nr:ABC transporter ATP-binding protein [Candidatus Roizmanbacteria bacterium]
MVVLSVSHLSKKFGDFIAVDDISFDLKEGEILGILGPNGAGKTTTIQMLLGVLRPDSGDVTYFGKEFNKHREEILEQVNFSSTYTNMPWELTVKENLTFISYLYTIEDRKKRVESIIKTFRLEEILNKQMNKLSAGQITRCNLAKGFINYPKVLLLDEPTASLDPEVAGFIRNFLLEERQKFQVSIILTSHNMAEVEEVCDRVIFINHGKVVADDTPDQLAKSIHTSHLELYVKDGLKRTIQFCEEQKKAHRIDGRYIVIDLKETEIPIFLKALMDLGIYYTEISIDKPSLEDYFLEVVGKKL